MGNESLMEAATYELFIVDAPFTSFPLVIDPRRVKIEFSAHPDLTLLH